jgi:hypothetical protein
MSFYNIKKSEMEALLLPLGFTQMSLPGVYELVYGKLVKKGKHQISMRIYTAIEESNGNSRECGSDGIRVLLFIKFNQKPLPIGKCQTIRRIPTWDTNLKKAIKQWDSEYKACPACGYPMVEKEGPRGKFWGCSTWLHTKCDGKPVKKEIAEPEPKAAEPVVQYGQKLPGYQIPVDKISGEQRTVVDLFAKSNRNIVLPSRAGGGKTTILRHLAGLRSSARMVYLAFNKKNAIEGSRKLPREVPSMTTHAFCSQLLRENGVRMAGKPKDDKNRIVLDSIYPADSSPSRNRLRKLILRLVGLSKNFAVFPQDKAQIEAIFHNYEMEVWDQKELEEVVNITSEVLSSSLPNAKFGMLYDYNDMIWWPVMLKLKTSLYNVVLLDEIQDFNACQIDLISRLLQSNVRVIAVGDEFQAVYRFRGADSDAFEKVSSVLRNDAKGSATQLLSTNYRCGKKIIEWVVRNTVVKDIKAAPDAIEGDVKENVSYAWILETLTKEYGSRDTA